MMLSTLMLFNLTFTCNPTIKLNKRNNKPAIFNGYKLLNLVNEKIVKDIIFDKKEDDPTLAFANTLLTSSENIVFVLDSKDDRYLSVGNEQIMDMRLEFDLKTLQTEFPELLNENIFGNTSKINAVVSNYDSFFLKFLDFEIKETVGENNKKNFKDILVRLMHTIDTTKRNVTYLRHKSSKELVNVGKLFLESEIDTADKLRIERFVSNLKEEYELPDFMISVIPNIAGIITEWKKSGYGRNIIVPTSIVN